MGEQLIAVWQAVKRAFSEWSVNTLGRDFILEFIAALAVAFVATRWERIRWYLTWERIAFRLMFGRGATRAHEVITVLDTFKDPRLLPTAAQKKLELPPMPPEGARFYKIFPDGHATHFSSTDAPILTYGSARAAAYVADGVSTVPGIGVRAIADEEIAARWDAAFVCIGNSYTNIKSDDVKLSRSNPWLANDGGEQQQLTFKDGQMYEVAQRQHLGYVLKIWNPFFPQYACVVCGGLGQWGTPGAAWYFGRHWRRLSRRFRANPFLIVLAITPGSDQAAEEIRAYGREAMWRRAWTWTIARFRPPRWNPPAAGPP